MNDPTMETFFYCVGASHMSDNRQMSVAMQRLVDLISMITNSTLLRNNTERFTSGVFSWSVHTQQSVAMQRMTQL
jgi:hypothetical protein